MPCYDKKLEAARTQLRDEGGGRLTDCVLTTAELDEIIQEHGCSLATLPESPRYAR